LRRLSVDIHTMFQLRDGPAAKTKMRNPDPNLLFFSNRNGSLLNQVFKLKCTNHNNLLKRKIELKQLCPQKQVIITQRWG